MSLDALHQHETERAMQTMAMLPPPPPSIPSRSAWNAVLSVGKGVAAGFTEGAAMLNTLQVQRSDRDIAMMSERDRELERQERESWEARYGDRTTEQVLRDAAHGLRPDPATASTAETIAFDAARVVTKAGSHVTMAGPWAGAGLVAVDETLAAADELQRQGVDRDTALKAGGIQGAVTGVGVVLPLAGSTLARTVGLYALGGPGLFVGQQAAMSEVLKGADYTKIAEAYDPLDPTGLAVSTLFPLPFAAAGIRRNIKASRITQEQTDAAMAHNLSLQADVQQATPIADAMRQIDDAVLAVDREAAAARGPAEPHPVFEAEEGAAPTRAAATEAKPGDMAAALEQLIESADTAAASADDPAALLKSLATRVQEIEEAAGGLVVRTESDGTSVTSRVTVADELARVRREAAEGSDAELGANDAQLLDVAANCALSLA